MEYQIKVALNEEALEPWVWIQDDSITGNSHIVIKKCRCRKTITVYKRTIDDNYKNLYNGRTTPNNIGNGNTLIISEYYRKKLNIEENTTAELEIKKSCCLRNTIPVWNSPNPTIQAANRVTIMSFVLGTISLVSSIVSICLH